MDIRKPEWKNRYLALTKGKTFHRLSPAIEEFFMAEVELFDVSLCNLSVTHSKLEDLIQDTRSRIADPIFSLWRFKEVNIPDVEEVVRTTKLEVEKLDSSLYKILEQNPRVSSNEIETVLVPEKEKLGKYEAILEEMKTRLPTYIDFINTLTPEIVRQDKSRTIIAVGYNPMQDIRKRNKLYRETIGNEKWLLGWEIKIVYKFAQEISIANDKMLREYDVSPTPTKEEMKRARISFQFPLPLGRDTVPAEIFYDYLRTKEPPIQEFIALGNKINKHFEKRTEAIFSG